MARRKEDIQDIYHLHGKNREYVRGDRTGEISAGDLDTGFRHSSRYHDFFEGYTEVKREKGNGKYTIERFYTDDWVVCVRPEKKKIRMAVYWLLFIASVAAMLIASGTRSASNNGIIGAVPLAVFIVAAVIMLIPLVKYITSGTRMTLHDYKSSSKRLIVLSAIAGGATFFSAIAGLVADLTVMDGITASDGHNPFIRLLLLIAAALCMGAVAFLESRFRYTKEANDTVVTGEGFKIR